MENVITNQEAFDKLTRAKSGLVLTSPFFASIIMHLKFVEDNTLNPPTMCTNSVLLKYSPDFVNKYTIRQLKGILAHEVLHIVMQHMFRCQGRDQKIFNMACDYAINPILMNLAQTDAQFEMPPDVFYDNEFNNMEAEAIYSIIYERMKNKQPPTKGSGRGGSNPIGDIEPYNQDMSDPDAQCSVEEQQQKTKIEVAAAQNAARMAGKLPANLDKLVDDNIETKLNWKEILARFITVSARNDYSWKMPNRRYLYQGMYLPILESPTLGTIAVIIDVSGSIGQDELNTFGSELKSILINYPDTMIQTLYVDTRVSGDQLVTIEDMNLRVKGGGGTDFRPGFVWLDEKGTQPICIIYFTDGYCDDFPRTEPDCPVLWVLTERARNNFTPPFGEVIHM